MNTKGVSAHLRSNVVGYLALFVALTGTAYAGSKIGSGDIKKNAVKSKQIKNGTVSGKDAKNNSLGAADLKEGAVGNSEIKADAVDGSKIKADAVASAEVDDGSLTGDDIDETTLPGQVVAFANVIGSTTNVSTGGISNLATGPGFNISSAQVTRRNNQPVGDYCIETDAPVIDNVLVSSSGPSSEKDVVVSYSDSVNSLLGCPAGTDVIVFTHDISEGGLADRNFSIWMTRNADT